jgi:hypothetical protein
MPLSNSTDQLHITEYSKQFLAKAYTLEKIGYDRDWVIEEYYNNGRAAERLVLELKPHVRGFSVRSFNKLCSYYDLQPKTYQQKVTDRGRSYNQKKFTGLIESLEELGYSKESLKRNYLGHTMNDLVERIKDEGLFIYKGDLRRVFVFYGIEQRKFSESLKLASPKRQKTVLKKYGVTNVAKSQIVKDRAKVTQVTNYLLECGSASKDLENLELPELLKISAGRTFKPRKYSKRSFTNTVYSKPESLFKNRIDRMGLKENIDYIHNDKSIISPFEIDFWFPILNFGIELNPTWTHASIGGFKPMSELYHYTKLNKMLSLGYDLAQLFDFVSEEKVIHKLKALSLQKTACINLPFSKTLVSGNYGRDLELESAGFTISKQLMPISRRVTRQGAHLLTSANNQLVVFDAGYLVYERLK